MSRPEHLHGDDCPDALRILEALARGRELPGIEPTETGAWVDWDELLGSWLSSTEKATVMIASGVARAERQGGLPYGVIPAVGAALAGLSTNRSLPQRSGMGALPALPDLGPDL
ncbi:MAG TPA: hypothetical protein VFA11_10480 [Acidimicrobiales bacterium]|nr:hypothetical protein [Acidimicrobiales bacterium]